LGDFVRARLVPELLVADIDASLRFWCGLCGFSVAYDRPEERFAYLDRDGAQVMLEERGRGRNWITGALEAPFGRGINFEVGVDAIKPILDTLASVPWPLFMAPERKWYRRAGTGRVGVHQFLVQDPDGYLIRFSERFSDGLQS
jgi:catechol 2,3-dioxygenase-like lactoylglutathione lyase family enzyme